MAGRSDCRTVGRTPAAPLPITIMAGSWCHVVVTWLAQTWVNYGATTEGRRSKRFFWVAFRESRARVDGLQGGRRKKQRLSDQRAAGCYEPFRSKAHFPSAGVVCRSRLSSLEVNKSHPFFEQQQKEGDKKKNVHHKPAEKRRCILHDRLTALLAKREEKELGTRLLLNRSLGKMQPAMQGAIPQ